MSALKTAWAKATGVAPHLIPIALTALAVLAILDITGVLKLPTTKGSSLPSLPAADAPPLEYVYLNSARVADYLGQVEDGLATSEQRTQQLMQSVNASISAGTAATLGASEQAQQGTQATVTPTGADRFYNFLRLLRQGGEASCSVIAGTGRCRPRGCNGTSRTRWLGEVDAESEARKVIDEVGCIGVGNFVRIAHVQLFLPPFAQALPRAQSATAVFGQLPARRTAFTSPTQSVKVHGGLQRFAHAIGTTVRLPFVAAPYGSSAPVGSGVTFFVPVEYQDLTAEPSLLSGSVTILGKIIYYAPGGSAYVDYPTIDKFGQAVLAQSRAFLNELGVCSQAPPLAVRPASMNIGTPHAACTSRQRTLDALTASVTYKPPVVVVLPLAIYQ